MVALPTKVSVDVGKVSVPVLLIVDITGDVRVLLVNVSVVALPIRVSVASGKVNVLAVVNAAARVPVTAVVLPDVVMLSFFVASVASIKLVVVVDNDLLVSVSVVALPTRVSVASGKVNVFAVVNAAAIVPVIFVVLPDVVMLSFFVASVASIKLVVVVDNDLLVNTSVVALPTKVSVASGNVNVFAVVNAAAMVPVIAVVLPEVVMFNFLVASVASTKLVVVVDKDLLVRVSVVARPTSVSFDVLGSVCVNVTGVAP